MHIHYSPHKAAIDAAIPDVGVHCESTLMDDGNVETSHAGDQVREGAATSTRFTTMYPERMTNEEPTYISLSSWIADVTTDSGHNSDRHGNNNINNNNNNNNDVPRDKRGMSCLSVVEVPGATTASVLGGGAVSVLGILQVTVL